MLALAYSWYAPMLALIVFMLVARVAALALA